MILGYETIINKIIEATSLPRNEIEARVEQKLKDLHDLISREGAAHIVANELNVKLFDNINKTLKIGDLNASMSSINLVGRVLNVYEIKSFNNGKRSGRIGSLLIGDETGTTRVVIWDEKLIDDIKNIQEGCVIKISNAYCKSNNQFNEMHLGSKSQFVVNPENENVGDVKINILSKKKQVKDFQPNELIESYGTIVEVFDPKFYQACPVCNKKVILNDDSFVCQEHQVVVPKQVPIVNFIFDDSTGNIRIVCFRDIAEKIIGKEQVDFENVKKENKGRQILIKGRVTKNEMFSRTELVASSIEDLDPAKLIAELELNR